MERIIEVSGLKKAYGKIQAVNDIDFHVNAGQLFAFLGPNGAGKSTTIDIICTLLEPDAGTVLVDGHRLGDEDFHIKSKIGVVFQDNLLDKLLTVKENLDVRGSFYDLDKQDIQEAIERAAQATGIIEFIDRPYGKLSGGQRRRADIARALINTPKILFLDEPTTGLDPQTRKSVWDTIQKLQRETGMTIFLTTHYMEEASRADYVVIIDEGKIAAKGTPTELREEYSSDVLTIHTNDQDQLTKKMNELKLSFEATNQKVTILLKRTIDAIPILNECKPWITHFEVETGTMDDAFIGITGKELRE